MLSYSNSTFTIPILFKFPLPTVPNKTKSPFLLFIYFTHIALISHTSSLVSYTSQNNFVSLSLSAVSLTARLCIAETETQLQASFVANDQLCTTKDRPTEAQAGADHCPHSKWHTTISLCFTLPLFPCAVSHSSLHQRQLKPKTTTHVLEVL